MKFGNDRHKLVRIIIYYSHERHSVHIIDSTGVTVVHNFSVLVLEKVPEPGVYIYIYAIVTT